MSDLDTHHRSDTPCLKNEGGVDICTIDETQKAQIQKKTRGSSEEQKWKDIYRIIFKLHSATEVPSPRK